MIASLLDSYIASCNMNLITVPVGKDGSSGPPGPPGSDGTKLLRCVIVSLMQYALNVEFYKIIAYILISTIGSI